MAKHPEDYKIGNTGVHAKYDDGQTLGSYCTDPEPFKNPAGVKMFAGFGADEGELDKGWLDPNISALPNYDKVNYKDRYSVPSHPDEGPGNHMSLPKDIEFRMKERESKGFLTRSHIPTER